MPYSQMGCDLSNLPCIDDESFYRGRMNAMQFEDVNPLLNMKTVISQYSYPQWQPTGDADGMDGPYRTPAYHATPPQSMDSAPSRYFVPPELTTQPPSPPSQPTVNGDEATYYNLFGTLDPDSTIPLPDEIEEQFDKHQFYGMDSPAPIILHSDLPHTNPHLRDPPREATPSTVSQVIDHDPPNEVDREEGVKRPRRSSKVSKKKATPGVPPPKGNNPFGSKGTRSCSSCRKRKGKCGYKNPDDDCSWCGERGLTCGPKLNKSEYTTVTKGQAFPKKAVSAVAKEIERENPTLEPMEVMRLLHVRIRENEEIADRFTAEGKKSSRAEEHSLKK